MENRGKNETRPQIRQLYSRDPYLRVPTRSTFGKTITNPAIQIGSMGTTPDAPSTIERTLQRASCELSSSVGRTRVYAVGGDWLWDLPVVREEKWQEHEVGKRPGLLVLSSPKFLSRRNS
eukprot:scaffold239_cov382-Pavlova_lutheri.AAC.1